jgi:hypothetical protein
MEETSGMTAPKEAAYQLLTCLLIGVITGMCYGFFRPLGRKSHLLRDLLFAPVCIYLWLFAAFRVCRGDIRMGYFAAQALGAVAWECTLGKFLQPVWAFFWKYFLSLFAPWGYIFKKTEKIIKFLFASGKKWVTIKGRNRFFKNPRPEGDPYGRNPEEKTPGPDRVPAQFHVTQVRDPGGYRTVYGGDPDSSQ